MSSTQQVQTILTRLARVQVYGVTALAFAVELDPDYVRAASDSDLARICGGVVPIPNQGGAHLYPDGHLFPS